MPIVQNKNSLVAGDVLQSNTYWMLYLTAFFGAVTVAITWPLILYIAKALNCNGFETGLLMSVAGIGQIISAPLLSKAMNKYGKKPTLIYCGLFSVIGWLIAILSFSWITSLIALFFSGVGAGTLVCVSSYFGAHTQKDERAGVFSKMLAFRGAGQMLGAACTALTVKQGLTLTFVFILFFGLITSLFGIFLPNSTPSRDQLNQQITPSSKLKITSALLLAFCAMGFLWVSVGTIPSFVPLYFKDTFNASEQQIATFFMALGATMVAAPVAIKFFERWPESKMALISFGVLAICMLLLASITHYGLALAVYVTWALFWDVSYPYLKANISRLAPESAQAQIQSAEQIITGAVVFMSSLIAGAIYGAIGAVWLFAGSAIISLIGVLCVWLSYKLKV